jgi:hypothetical protein
MSVLIKGMEMPESCENCWFNFNLFFSRCGLTHNKLKYIGDKNDDCPLVEIPSKHGDLIDRQELLRLLDDSDFSYNSEAFTVVTEVLESSPTIIEAEE